MDCLSLGGVAAALSFTDAEAVFAEGCFFVEDALSLDGAACVLAEGGLFADDPSCPSSSCN